jgi:hypothetical protein
MVKKKRAKRPAKYERKLAINGTLDDVLRASVPKSKKKTDKKK